MCYYTKLIIASLLLPFMSSNWLTPSCNIIVGYSTPLHYYTVGKKFPAEAKECLYKVYKDRDFVDSLRYIIDKDFFYSRRIGYINGICLGRLIVFDFNPFGYGKFGSAVILHEVMHSVQIRKDTKVLFLISLLYQTLTNKGYKNTNIEKEAIEAERKVVLCR